MTGKVIPMRAKVTPKTYLELQREAIRASIRQNDTVKLQNLSRQIWTWFHDQQLKGVVLAAEDSYEAGLLTGWALVQAARITDGHDLLEAIQESKQNPNKED